MDIRERAAMYYPDTVRLRRAIHQAPELSGHEKQTAQLVRRELASYGIAYKELPENGTLGFIDGKYPGKTVALRADMDALPIQEESAVPYRSKVDGCGHLCGHDCHTSSLLTAARILNECKNTLHGRVVLMFQPSEENSGFGAHEMVENGAMENVDAVFGVHVLNDIDVGHVSVQAGPRTAASLRVTIHVLGVGGHGGMPHKCVDAIVAASAIVMNLQTIVSREIDPQEAAAISVCTFHAGTSQFAISDHAELELTVKYFDTKLTEHIKESIIRIAHNTASAYRAQCTVDISHPFMPVVNDAALSELARQSLQELYGAQAVAVCHPWSASEDFSEYTTCAPGVFAFVGGRNAETGCIYSAHHPQFNVDEKCLEYASALYAQFAIDYLNKQ